MDDDKVKSWQAPTFESTPERRKGWVEDAINEGDEWLRSQHAYQTYDSNIALLSSDGKLKLNSNSLKPDIRKFVETIADVREIATFGTASEGMKKWAQMFNRVVDVIYRKSHFPRQSRKALQYAMAGRGYLWPRYIQKDFGWGEGTVEFTALSLHEVLPVQLPKDHDMQGAYAVSIMDCLGIAEAHARFSRFQEQLQPVARTKIASNGQVRRLEWWDRHKFGTDSKDWEKRYCEIRYTFVRDLRINKTGRELQMGDSGASWAYTVPSVGQLIANTHPGNGLPESRKATVEDCRIYPQLRLIISNPGMSIPLYDGPAFDWHGQIPAIAYDVDDWPWMAVGYSLIHDVAGVERGQRAFIDLMYRVLRIKMNPPKGYDLNAGIPREDLKRFNWLDEEGTAIGVDGDAQKALRSLLPESVQVTQQDFEMVKMLEAMRQKTLGLNDLSALANLKFNLSTETTDKILESIGPIAKGIAGNMETAHAKIAQMLKFMIPQYYSTRKLLGLIGPDAIETAVFDKQPETIVPSHTPGEESLAAENKPSEKTPMQRARWFAENLNVISVPSFLLNVTHMQEQMKWLNYLQRGFPISFATAFKKLGVDNWGDTPGNTEFEKWQHEQIKILEMKIKAAQVAGAEGMGEPAQAGKGKSGQGKGGGRPPSAQKPPHLETRGKNSGNLRTVVSQSK